MDYRFYVSHNPCKLGTKELREILGPDVRVTHPRGSIRAIVIVPNQTEQEVLLKLAKRGTMMIIETVR